VNESPTGIQTQALRRIEAYGQEFTALGLSVTTKFRVLAVLTSGLPGEVLELSLLDEAGQLTTHRARPLQPVPPEASRIHHLTDEVLQNEVPLLHRKHALLVRLRSPDIDGQPVKVIAWAGSFVQAALEHTLNTPLGLDILSIQDAVARGDRVLDPTASQSTARITAQLLALIFARQAIHSPPPQDRSSFSPRGLS